MKALLHKTLVCTLGAPIIAAGEGMMLAGKALIVTGGIVHTKGAVVKDHGQDLRDKHLALAAEEQKKTMTKKEALELQRHQRRMDKLEAEINRERQLYRASAQTLEAELA